MFVKLFVFILITVSAVLDSTNGKCYKDLQERKNILNNLPVVTACIIVILLKGLNWKKPTDDSILLQKKYGRVNCLFSVTQDVWSLCLKN